jgi:hypothetical protein
VIEWMRFRTVHILVGAQQPRNSRLGFGVWGATSRQRQEGGGFFFGFWGGALFFIQKQKSAGLRGRERSCWKCRRCHQRCRCRP